MAFDETPDASQGPSAKIHAAQRPLTVEDVRPIRDAYLEIQAYLRSEQPLVNALQAVRLEREKPELRDYSASERHLLTSAYHWFMDRFMARFSDTLFPENDNDAATAIARWFNDFTATDPYEALNTLKAEAKKITAPDPEGKQPEEPEDAEKIEAKRKLKASSTHLLGLLTTLEQAMDSVPGLKPKDTLATEAGPKR